MAPKGLIARVLHRVGYARKPNVRVVDAAPGIHVDWNVPVTVRDGTVLRVNVYRPVDGAPAPVIMSAHPYGKDKIPAKTRSRRGINFQYRILPQPHLVEFSEYTSWEAPDPSFWVPRGYVVINADARGGGTSEGPGDLFSDQEAQDSYDLIEWAAAQPWSTGRVGLDGVSYLAISQYKVAALQPPHLAAICPWEGFTDLYRDFARPGGVREDGFTILWSNATRIAARMRTNIREQIVARPERDAWYQSLAPELERITVPMLVCGSFSDHSLHSRGSYEAFRRAGSALKKLYTHRDGKWAAYYGAEASAARLRFFDHTLKGIANGCDADPAVRLAIYDAGPDAVAVVAESSWPPADVVWTKHWLHADAGTLVPDPPASSSTVTFSLRRGVASFAWTVPEDVDSVGPMALRIFVELRGTDDAFLFVGVRKFRDGTELVFEGTLGFGEDMVSKGWQRAAHRELDARLTTPEQPVHTHLSAEPLRVGEIVPVDIALRQHATRFRKGDVIRLDVRGSWLYRRDPFYGEFPTGYQRSGRGTCVLHTGDEHQAFLLVPQRACVTTA